MTPPTSNPSAMSQERLERLRVELKTWHSSMTKKEMQYIVTALLSAQRKNEELVRALTEIANFEPTTNDFAVATYCRARARGALSIPEEPR